MGIRNIRRKLAALDAGGPLPIYKTQLTRVTANPIIVSFVRMSGETRPFGIAYGKADQREPYFLNVADPRRRADVATMLEEFATWILEQTRVVAFSAVPLLAEKADANDLTQIWMLGKTHVDMLHFFQYEHQKFRNDATEPTALGAFGRLCGWLFRQSQLRGNQVVIDANALLSEMYEFPADDFSLRHAGVQMAWLTTPGPLNEKREAAIHALRNAVSVTMEPQFENEELVPLLATDSPHAQGRIFSKAEVEQIGQVLKPKLEYRWRMTAEIHRIALVEDGRRENLAVTKLVQDQVTAFITDFNELEKKIGMDEWVDTPPANSNQSAVSSAKEFLAAERAEQRWIAELVHDDDELLMDSLIEGTALSGTVVEVALVETENGRSTQWKLELSPRSSKYFKRRTHENLAPYKSKNRFVEATEFEYQPPSAKGSGGTWFVYLLWDKENLVDLASLKALPKSSDWIGKQVAFAPTYSEFFFTHTINAVNQASKGAGAWLLSKPIEQESEDVID